jgi:hypothetical protein
MFSFHTHAWGQLPVESSRPGTEIIYNEDF